MNAARGDDDGGARRVRSASAASNGDGATDVLAEDDDDDAEDDDDDDDDDDDAEDDLSGAINRTASGTGIGGITSGNAPFSAPLELVVSDACVGVAVVAACVVTLAANPDARNDAAMCAFSMCMRA
jgi:hypothetical protein